MNPYYQDDYVTIFHGDCRFLLPELHEIDVIITDPPYGVSYKKTGEPYMIGDTVNIFPYFMPLARQCLKDSGAAYIFSSTTKLVEILPLFQTYFKLHSLIIWDKIIGQIPRQMSHYKLRYEPILYGSMGLHRLNAYQDDVIQCQIDRGYKRVHPTQKPVSLIEYLLKNSTNKKSLVLDPFLGSGTTTVACKHLGIRCIGIEIEEKYCELAAKRVSQEMVFETDNNVLQQTPKGAAQNSLFA